MILLSDIPVDIIGDIDRTIVRRARDVVTDATMAEIMDEEPNGPLAFRDAVRQQILVLRTHLHISLVVIDKLMALANSLRAGLPN